jgi:hypothetical protein
MKVTLKQVFRGEQETRFGTRQKLGIKIEETEVTLADGSKRPTEDKWLSAMFKMGENTGTEKWAQGDKVGVEITEKNGYLNFVPKDTDIEDRLEALEKEVFGTKKAKKVKEEPKDEPIDEPEDW